MTGSVKRIDEKMGRLEPGSLRYQIMAALRQFRASWIELGRLLNEVVYGGDYKEWGYDDFEVYCARELGLKKPTVQKLMVSYNYMKKYETKRLHDFEDGGSEEASPAIPDFQTVELLDRARRSDNAPGERVEELHRRAFDGDAEEEPEIRKEIRQVLKPQMSEEAMRAGSDNRKAELAGIVRAARELRRRLSSSKAVPAGLKDRIEQCLADLEALD